VNTLQEYLYSKIPLVQAMQLQVLQAGPEGVVLRAPLAPNINHIGTAFGGSESALAILAAWSVLYERLKAAGTSATIIIQRNSIQYQRPVDAEFTASAYLTEPDDWQRFMRMLQRHGRARINISSTIDCEGVCAARFEGDFIAAGVSPIV
jgi:thioesterase domain-containing protein